jgi:hypothetical protein
MTGLPGRQDVGEERFLGGRSLGPKAQVGLGVGMGALALVFVVLEGVISNATGLHEWGWWILFVGLLVACVVAASVSLALLRQGMAGLSGPSYGARRHLLPEWPMPTSDAGGSSEKRAERQLLEAIDHRGEITPARAALETSLTVEEADRMLSDLAKGGHLEVRVEGGKLLYGL